MSRYMTTVIQEEEGVIHSFFAEGGKHVNLWAVKNVFKGDMWIFAYHIILPYHELLFKISLIVLILSYYLS
jgi:hypothetical protein